MALKMEKIKMNTLKNKIKVFLTAIFMCVALKTSADATSKVYGANLANESALAYNSTYTLNTANNGAQIDYLSFQALYTSATIANATFTDGTQSTGSFTVSSNTYVRSSTPMISLNGITISYTPGSTSSATAKSISDSIMANTSLNTLVRSTWTTGGVVVATTTAVGTSTNYTLFSSSQAAIGVSGPVTIAGGYGTSAMTGGTNSGYALNSPIITLVTNPFAPGDSSQASALALPVLYTGTPAIGGLTTGTTYFVIPVSKLTIELATTSARAVAGLPLTITSSSTQTTADTYTLAPLAISGASISKSLVRN